MISKTLQRKIMGVIVWLSVLTYMNFLQMFNLTLETKLIGVPIKVVYLVTLAYVGYYLIFNKELI